MRIGVRAAPVVVVLEHVLNCLLDAIEIGHLTEHAAHAALGTRPVVAKDIDDHCILKLTSLADGRKQPADLVVAVFAKTGIHFHLPGEELLLVWGQLVPILDGLGFVGQFGARRDHAHGDLFCMCFFAQFIPALVELAFILGYPLLGHMMRRMGCAGGEIHEERLFRSQCFLELHPGNGLVGHVGHEIVAFIMRRGDPGHPVVDCGIPLVGLAAIKAVKLVKSRTRWPAIGRSGDAYLPGCGLVVLAEEAGAVAVQTQHLSHWCDAVRSLSRITREGRGGFGDAAHIVHMMVAA